MSAKRLLDAELTPTSDGASEPELAALPWDILEPSLVSELPIPPALDQVIVKCLDKEPAGRPRDAATLAGMLSEAVAGERWSPDRARSWCSNTLPPI